MTTHAHRAHDRHEPEGGAMTYDPPTMTNGKTWADYAWWKGAERHEAPQQPSTFAEAEALTWARCWGYIEEMNLTADECRIVWPIACAALNACAMAMATREIGGGDRG